MTPPQALPGAELSGSAAFLCGACSLQIEGEHRIVSIAHRLNQARSSEMSDLSEKQPALSEKTTLFRLMEAVNPLISSVFASTATDS